MSRRAPEQDPEDLAPAAIARGSMLRIAETWQRLGQINQAIDAYTRILERYPGSAEAQAAGDQILTLAKSYEQQGRYHLALSLYRKLERAS